MDYVRLFFSFKGRHGRQYLAVQLALAAVSLPT